MELSPLLRFEPLQLMKKCSFMHKMCKFPTPIDASIPWAPLLDLATFNYWGTRAPVPHSWWRQCVCLVKARTMRTLRSSSAMNSIRRRFVKEPRSPSGWNSATCEYHSVICLLWHPVSYIRAWLMCNLWGHHGHGYAFPSFYVRQLCWST